MSTLDRNRESFVSPQLTAFLALTPSLRRLLEAAVEDALNFAESMTLFLDEVDGDPEGEPDDPAEDADPPEFDGDESEPNLGSLSHRHQPYWAIGGADDLEVDAGDEPELDPADGGIGDQDGFEEQWRL